MEFGEQTVGFVVVVSGEPDGNGVRPKARTQVNVAGCRFRPLRADEAAGLTGVSSKAWKCTAPPDEVVLAADAVGELVYDGTDTPQRGGDDANVWEIEGGALPFNDFSNDVFKVTVFATNTRG
ncbi:hypothetical protein [Mycolicibacterium vaccae]|uniref:hypothetical protein n=1 Tax=Mycolicibacterium vaccae TaxID=1810 RepID=UPI003D04A25E